uniref:Uncharacterized protein n=1 Tax=Arundo donax TaxID=35708 RepID=A0A0A9CKQ5_ARUDO
MGICTTQYNQNFETHPAPLLPRGSIQTSCGNCRRLSVTSSSSHPNLSRPSHRTQALLVCRRVPSLQWTHSHCSSGRAGLEFLSSYHSAGSVSALSH